MIILITFARLTAEKKKTVNVISQKNVITNHTSLQVLLLPIQCHHFKHQNPPPPPPKKKRKLTTADEKFAIFSCKTSSLACSSRCSLIVAITRCKNDFHDANAAMVPANCKSAWSRVLQQRTFRSYGVVRITSRYPKFNGSHFGLLLSAIHRMTRLGGNFVCAQDLSVNRL